MMMRLKLQRTAAAAAAAAAVAVRAPSPQANERRMAKEKTDTYTRGQGKNQKHLQVNLKNGVVTLLGRIIIIAFVSCINMWCFQPEQRRSPALFASYLTYPADFRRVEIFYG